MLKRLNRASALRQLLGGSMRSSHLARCVQMLCWRDWPGLCSLTLAKSSHHSAASCLLSRACPFACLQCCVLPQGEEAQDSKAVTCVTLTDLQCSLDALLTSKGQSPAAAAAASSAAAASALESMFARAGAAPPAAAPPPAPASTTTAPPAASLKEAGNDVAAEEGEEEWEEVAAPPAPPGAAAGGFGGLSQQFLQDVQAGLEALGYDLTSSDVMARLAGDEGLVQALLQQLVAGGAGGDAALLIQSIKQWQRAIAEQMALELELKRKKQRPVWRCAACGRYGCPVAPYIERLEEVDG